MLKSIQDIAHMDENNLTNVLGLKTHCSCYAGYLVSTNAFLSFPPFSTQIDHHTIHVNSHRSICSVVVKEQVAKEHEHCHGVDGVCTDGRCQGH